MRVFISSMCIALFLALGGCGGSSDTPTVGTSSKLPVKPENNLSTQCFEPNIINVNSIRVIDGDTVEVIPDLLNFAFTI